MRKCRHCDTLFEKYPLSRGEWNTLCKKCQDEKKIAQNSRFDKKADKEDRIAHQIYEYFVTDDE